MTNSGNNQELTALFNALCLLSNEAQSEQSQLKALARQVIQLMRVSLESQLDLDQVGKPFTMPYKDLTDLVFSHQGKFPTSGILANFRDLIAQEVLMNEYCTIGIDTEEEQQERKNHFIHCYDKVINHIQLAQVQYNFINTAIKSASDLAEQASDLAKETQMIIGIANTTAKEAKNTAAQANRTADKAEKTYNTMFANYVTILGIFTAIIVTIFGGLNVVDTVISYGNTYFSTIVFLAALVLMCVVCLLYFLAKIILKLNGKDDDNQRFTLECLFGVVFGICLVLILVAWCASPAKITPDHPTKTEQKAAQ